MPEEMLWPCSQYEANSVRLLGLLVALIELTNPGGHADIAIDERQCPLLAQSRHGLLHRTCLLLGAFCENPLSWSLLGAKRTCPFALHMSANDPKRTLVGGEQPELAIIIGPFGVLV
jgi:hypothetical protein